MSVIADNTLKSTDNPTGGEQLRDTLGVHTPRLAYMPGIDGLRAIAVVAVLLYHASIPFMAGGFLGVEVFFVISGYLITRLLLSEWQASGTINLGRFWLRRARRLLPAVYVLILAVLLFAVLVLPEEVAALRWDALAAALYTNNWYQIFSQLSYFEAIGRPSLLRHLWSLAVEEQFYVICPILLVLCLRWMKDRSIRLLPLLCLICAAASTLLMAGLYQPDADPSRIYYGTDTRASGFLIGAALAAWVMQQPTMVTRRWRGIVIDVVGLLSLGGLALCFVVINEIHPMLYLGGFALVAILSAVAIIAADHPAARLVPALLRPAILRWIGLRSYSIYLWHWSIYMVTRPGMDVPLDGFPLLALRLALTFVLAELSYRYIEQPIRDGALGRLWMRTRSATTLRARVTTVLLSVTAAVSLTVLGSSVIAAQPMEVPAEYAEVDDVAVSTPINSVSEPTQTVVALATAATTPPPTSGVQQTVTPTPSVGKSMMPTATPVIRRTDSASIAVTRTKVVTNVLGAGARITAIGDSVMLGARRELRTKFNMIIVDAEVSRQAVAATKILRSYQEAGTLGSVVIIHIGNNGFVTARQFDDMLSVLREVPHVVVLTLQVPRRWQDPNNTVIREGVKKANNTHLVEWHDATALNPKLFVSDGVHLQAAGRQLYVEMIEQTLATLYLPEAASESPGAR